MGLGGDGMGRWGSGLGEGDLGGLRIEEVGAGTRAGKALDRGDGGP